MATKQRQQRSRHRRNEGPSSFQRRLTWCEVEDAFDYLFEVGVDGTEMRRITLRFRRARSQLLPIFSSMVVSPYESERVLALQILEKMGGRSTLKALEEILDDEDVHDAYKLDVKRLRDTLEGSGIRPLQRGISSFGEDDEDEDEPPTPEEKPAAKAKAPAPRPAPEPAATTDEKPGAKLFDEPSERFLAALEGPIAPIFAAFTELPERKRLSFVDRLTRIKDERLVPFLTALLESTDWALIQSALKVVGESELRGALDAVRKIAETASRKRVQMRAQRVLERLQGQSPEQPETAEDEALPEGSQDEGDQEPQRGRSRSRRRGGRRSRSRRSESEGSAEPQDETATAASADEAPPEAEAETEPAVAAEAKQDDSADGGPKPKRPGRGRRGRDEDEGAPEADGQPAHFLAPPPAATLPPSPPCATPEKLPKLQGCYASGLDRDGRQRLVVCRVAEQDGQFDCLTVLLDAELGWVAAQYQPGLTAAEAAAEREELVGVTAGYVRTRVDEATVTTQQRGGELPAAAEACLSFIGGGRKAEPVAELPAEDAPNVSQEEVEQLLEHPLFAAWWVALVADSGPVSDWLSSGRRRSAARVRRRIIDDVLAAWLTSAQAARLQTLLRQQAWLLERNKQTELADIAARAAAELEASGSSLMRHRLARELVYRGLLVGQDERRGYDRGSRSHAALRLEPTVAEPPAPAQPEAAEEPLAQAQPEDAREAEVEQIEPAEVDQPEAEPAEVDQPEEPESPQE